MSMHKISLFLAKNSQKIALMTSAIGISVAYLMQPNYEVFSRWALIKTCESKELRPSQRITRIADVVCQQFDLTNEQKMKLDFFLTGLDQSVPIGSVLQSGYAFIGLPYFATYSNSLEIPTDEGQFYTRQFPHGPYSPIGKQLLKLAVVPEPAVQFMIARELVRLGAKPKNGSNSVPSARFKSMVTVSGIGGGLYLAYQLSYFLNRAFRLPTRWSLPSRLLCYTVMTTVGLFCQWQGVLAWRRSLCFHADQIVAHISPSLLEAGLIYYDWRLRYNRFCYDRAVDRHLRKARQKKDNMVEYDPIRAYQEDQLALQRAQEQEDQQKLKESPPSVKNPATASVPVQLDRNAMHDQQSGYFLPRVDGVVQDTMTEPARPDASSLHLSGYAIHPRLNAGGNERWAADGDALAFGLTELLSLGYVWSPLARLLALFVSPATSESRLARLRSNLDKSDV